MNLLETLKSSGLDKAAYNGFNSMTDSKTVFNIYYCPLNHKIVSPTS